MRLAFRAASAAIFVLAPNPLFASDLETVETAQVRAATEEEEEGEDIVVTGARTRLPITALPLTADVIDKETLDQQVAVSGSVVDAVSALSPSFSPTR